MVLRIVALESSTRIVSLLVALDGVLGVIVSPHLADEEAAVVWAERQVAAGELFDGWWHDDAA
jgi:hypothetical protein